MSADQITLGQLESHLWESANILRGPVDAADFKTYIFPLLFFKRICDVWDEEYQEIVDETGDEQLAWFPESHRFQIPEDCHWNDVRTKASNVGAALQRAMREIEKANPDTLYGVFGDAQWSNKDRLSDALLKDLIEHFSKLPFGNKNVNSDLLGDAYEYLIKKFADATNKKAGEFYTPRSVVRLMIDMLDPKEAETIYDPACGTGGMLLAAVQHVKEQHGDVKRLWGKLYGQEKNLTTSSIARMNLFLHGIEDFQVVRGDTLRNPAFFEGALDEVRERTLSLNKDRQSIGQIKYDKQMDWCDRARFKLERDLGMSWGYDNVAKKIGLFDKRGKHPLFTPEIYEDFTRRLRPPVHTQQQGIMVAFDAKQQALTVSKPGFAKVKGVAGCGKTTILAQRAINAHARHRSQVLILTFNITLRHYIRDTISRLQGGSGDFYEVIHYHAFISTQLNNYGINLKSKIDELPPAQRTNLDTIFGMKSLFKGVETEKYQTILIDEVQDYDPEWIKLVRDCFLAKNGEMILFGDQSQNIYDRPSDSRESPIVLGFGSWVRLTKSYRSAADAALLDLFRNFQMQHLIRKYADSEIFDVKATQASMRYDLLNYETYGKAYDPAFIFEKIQNYIREYQLHPNDIALVSSKVEWLIPLNEAFKKFEKTKVMFEEDAERTALTARMDPESEQFKEEIDTIRRRKKCFFMQNSGLIKLSTIHSFKGLEAQTVFCILAPEDEAEMVYTGITRAQKNLVVFDSSESSFRPFFQTHMTVV